MAAPNRATGSRSPNYRGPIGGDGVNGGQPGGGGGRGGGGGGKGSPSGNGGKGGGGKKGGKGKGKNKNKHKRFKYNLVPLNPPFDPRIRQIGAPYHRSKQMKRGWVQTEDDKRVNFLFNPSQFDISHSVNADQLRNPDYIPTDDVMDPNYVSMTGGASIKLLYDRSYEILGGSGYAHRFGVWADVAAWYTALDMLDDYPNDWKDTIIQNPPQLKTAYMFIGGRMAFYGYITQLAVTISHWNQQMVPMRGSVDLSWELLPHTQSAPLRGKFNDETITQGYFDNWIHDGDLGGHAVPGV